FVPSMSSKEGTGVFYCNRLQAPSLSSPPSSRKVRELKEYHTMITSSQTKTTRTTTTVDNALDLALKKITEVEVPQGKHIALAYSGGLDSTLCVELSHLKYHSRKLTAITVDVGQGDAEIKQSTERAAKLGITPLVIDAKQE